jgi:uncharacterized membrane protein
LLAALATWLLFIPNGPYLVTDIMHLLDHRRGPLLWFDLILFFSYAHLGLLLAMYSAAQIEDLLSKFAPRVVAKLSMMLLFFAIAFGVYLGRFLRWNSWDLFYKPWDIARELTDCLNNPAEHAKAYLITVLFGTMLNAIYYAFSHDKKV